MKHTMKPQFEKHEDQLFRMLEENEIVPLTPDAEMPCLIRLIQDDSPMGRYNKAYSEYKNGVVNDIEWDVSRYEIIGTLVKEGSSEWALYQMMQGKTVCQKYSRIKRYYEAGYVRWMMPHNKEISQHLPADVFLKNFAGTMNWQIYEEPKPESENIIHGHIPADMHLKYIHLYEFKVGDWVEVEWENKSITHEQVKKVRKDEFLIQPDESCCYTAIQIDTMKHETLNIKCIRKLSPSEVIVKIGCLSGTVEPVSINGIHIWFQLIDINDRIIATIRISSLDTQTREIVESLIKGQEEENAH